MNTSLKHTQKFETAPARLRNLSLEIREIKQKIGSNIDDLLDYICRYLGVILEVRPEVRTILQYPLHKFLPAHGKFSLEKILNFVLANNNLDYHLNHHLLRIFPGAARNELKVTSYDVRDLVAMGIESQIEYLGEEMFLGGDESHKIFGINFAEFMNNAPDMYYTESTLAQLISEKVLKKYRPDLPMGLISCTPGTLSVSHLPRVHRQIQIFLDTLRQLAATPITLDIQFITCKNNFFKQVELEFSPLYLEEERSNSMMLYSELNPQQRSQLFQAIDTSKDAAVCFRKISQLRHLESRYINNAHRTHFLAGYDKHSQQDIIGCMYEGCSVKIRPEIIARQQTINLDLDIEIATIVKPLPALPVRAGEIALPTQLAQHINAQISFAQQNSFLLAGLANPYEDEGEKSFSPARKKEHLMVCCRANVSNTF